jgi:hypothetical protein
MRIIFLIIIFLMSGKCFAQNSDLGYSEDNLLNMIRRPDTMVYGAVTMPLGGWIPGHNTYLPYFPKTVTVDTNTSFKPYLIVKEVTSNYTLTEHDNGNFIYVNATANITIPLFKVPFTCTVARVGAGRVTFTGAVWRLGFTPLSSRLQSVTVTALPNRIAIIL